MSAFQASGEGRYVLAVPESGVEFDVDRLRRERHQLYGELTVRCRLAGAPRVLSIADFNLSSDQARYQRARACAAKAQTSDIKWSELLETFCQRVLEAERRGQPAVLLRDVPRPSVADQLDIEGLTLLDRHPIIIFGDGGAAKSYTGLYLAGRLEQRGLRVLYADWEFAADDHRDRLERLFGTDMPGVHYVRCEKPLVYEADRLRRLVREHEIGFCFYDSIAFACDGPPEAAEVAGAYFRAVRQIGVGSLHIAHVSKGEHADRKPFGSTFWHNGARATWYVKLASESQDQRTITLGLYNRKANTGPARQAVGFEITFDEERTTFKRVNVADVPDLAAGLTLYQRLTGFLRAGAHTRAEIATQFDDATDETLRRTINRAIQRGRLGRFPGPGGVEQIGLPAREVS